MTKLKQELDKIAVRHNIIRKNQHVHVLMCYINGLCGCLSVKKSCFYLDRKGWKLALKGIKRVPLQLNRSGKLARKASICNKDVRLDYLGVKFIYTHEFHIIHMHTKNRIFYQSCGH